MTVLTLLLYQYLIILTILPAVTLLGLYGIGLPILFIYSFIVDINIMYLKQTEEAK